MPDQDQQPDLIDDIFNLDELADIQSNQRKTIRYVRGEILASIKKNTFFSLNKPIQIELHNISTKGALITADKKLNVKNKLTLYLTFEDDKTFQIEAKVVRIADPKAKKYGLQFNRYNNELGEHLLKTQTDLLFD
jgi:PilZ domain